MPKLQVFQGKNRPKLSNYYPVKLQIPLATIPKCLPQPCWHWLTGGGTFDSAIGGTFHSDTPGTFESDMDGTFKVSQSNNFAEPKATISEVVHLKTLQKVHLM